MALSFLTPLGAAFALTALLPLAICLVRERRARRIRRAIGLRHPSHVSRLPLVVALAAVPGLLALAAMQPVIETTRTVHERTDAEAFVVVDISRSMLAAAAAGAPTRLERARLEAEKLRVRFPQMPIGILSMTDRILPHLFPTTDRQVFAATLEQAIGIERPPPVLFYSTRATSLESLAGIPARDYFSPSARKRLLIVLTDGESRPLEGELAKAFSRRPRIETLLIHYWEANERIYETGVAERGYRPDRASTSMLANVATRVGGHVFAEGQSGELQAAAAEALGSGPTRERVIEGERRALMPYATLVALIPLSFVLLRRNL
ncbi:MAG: VWA domain-containing protein [Actinobacteria bacterium]|nr:VWA domain-containing protein [Actinomycetota bacterium]